MEIISELAKEVEKDMKEDGNKECAIKKSTDG